MSLLALSFAVAGALSPVAALPPAPAVTSVVASNAALAVALAPVAGAAGYVLATSPATARTATATTSATLVGLANGTAYGVSAAASNAAGVGPWSPWAAPATPAGAPGVPALGKVAPASSSNAALVVAFAPSSRDVPGAVTYVAVATPGGASARGPASPLTIAGLVGGSNYACTVAASNAYGVAWAASSNAATVTAAPTATVDAVGTSLAATIVVTCTPSGGYPPAITYVATATSNGVTTYAAGSNAAVAITGLAGSSTYAVTMSAVNAAGLAPAVALGGLVTTAPAFACVLDAVNHLATATAPYFATPSVITGLTVGALAANASVVVKQTSQTVTAFTASDWFTATADDNAAWIVVKGDLTIASGQTFVPPARKLFTVLCATGNLTINGTVSMTARGANHSGTGNSGGYTAPVNIPLAVGSFSNVTAVTIDTNPIVPATGGAALVNLATSSDGNPGTNGGTGGGGTGYWEQWTPATARANAAAGTCFGGGSAAGAVRAAPNETQTTTAVANGGAGGTGVSTNTDAPCSGGAGNDGGPGSGANSTPGGAGTGGVLIVVCKGTLYGTGGALVANGVSGGIPSGGSYRMCGGGSGGGSITLFCKTDASASVSMTAAGGPAVSYSGYASRAGGAGSVRKLMLP